VPVALALGGIVITGATALVALTVLRRLVAGDSRRVDGEAAGE